MKQRKQKDPPLISWSCKGCTNTVERNGATSCRPMVEGRLRMELQGNTIVCLDKETRRETE